MQSPSYRWSKLTHEPLAPASAAAAGCGAAVRRSLTTETSRAGRLHPAHDNDVPHSSIAADRNRCLIRPLGVSFCLLSWFVLLFRAPLFFFLFFFSPPLHMRAGVDCPPAPSARCGWRRAAASYLFALALTAALFLSSPSARDAASAMHLRLRSELKMAALLFQHDPALQWRPHTMRQGAAMMRGPREGDRGAPSVRGRALAAHNAAALAAFSAAGSAMDQSVHHHLVVQNNLEPEGYLRHPYGIALWEAGEQVGCPVRCSLHDSLAAFAAARGADAAPSALLALEPTFWSPGDTNVPGSVHAPGDPPVFAVWMENHFRYGPSAAGNAWAFGGSMVIHSALATAVFAHSAAFASFELDSHVPTLHLPPSLTHWRTGLPRPVLREALALQPRRSAVAVFISNCKAAILPDRAAWIREFSELYPVHHYGRCDQALVVGGTVGQSLPARPRARNSSSAPVGWPRFAGALDDMRHPRCGSSAGGVGGGSYGGGARVDPSSKIDVLQEYRWVLAIENSVGLDYVTEKVFDGLVSGAVPLYLGAPNVWDFLPSPAAIVDIRSFPAPADVANYLRIADADPETLLDTHHAWRMAPPSEHFSRLQNISLPSGPPPSSANCSDAGDSAPTLACRLCGCAAGFFDCPAQTPTGSQRVVLPSPRRRTRRQAAQRASIGRRAQHAI